MTPEQLAASLIAALTARVEGLTGALVAIDAMDPEDKINGFSESALRGTILHMGGIARAALARAMDPALSERAGNLLPELQKAMVPYDPEVDAQEYWETLCSLSADLITALLAQNAALRAERDDARKWAAEQHACADRYAARADAAEAQIAALTARVERLTGALEKINVGEGWAAKIARAALSTTEEGHE